VPEEKVLRLGVDPRAGLKGHAEFQKASKETKRVVDELAKTLEDNARREARTMREIATLERDFQTRKRANAQQTAMVAAQAGREQAKAQVAALEVTFRESIARIKEGQARGFLTPAEAAQAGRESALAYNQAVIGVIDRSQGSRALTGAGGRETYTELAGSLKSLDQAGRSSSLGMHRLNNSLVVMARQATNTHPVVGQLADVVGTFAIGTAAMVPILAGIAAIGLAWQRLTRDAREAKEEHQRLIDVLESAAEGERIRRLGPGGELGTGIGAGQQELADLTRRIEAERQRIAQTYMSAGAFSVPEGATSGRLQALEEQYARLIPIVQRGEQALARETAEEAERRAKEYERETERIIKTFEHRVDAAERANTQIERAFNRHFDERAASLGEFERQVQEDFERQMEAFERAQAAAERAEAARIAATLRRLAKERKAEEELARARERANQMLVRQLNEVGRAYGGVIDQILTLAATVLALERMPMVSGGDKAKAYGTAAGIGIGVGASTGSPAMGALGGAAAGFSVAGPYGALIGGAAGFVSGLIEQGERLALARKRWEDSFEGFQRMFNPGSPLDQMLERVSDSFARLAQEAAASVGVSTSITTAEEARRFIEAYEASAFVGMSAKMHAFVEGLKLLEEQFRKNEAAARALAREEERRYADSLQVRLLEAQGHEDEARALQLAIRHEEEMRQAIEAKYNTETLALLESVQAAEKMAEAVQNANREIDNVTNALNSPTGLNIALARWRTIEERVRDGARPPWDRPPRREPHPGEGDGGRPPRDPEDRDRRGDTYQVQGDLTVQVIAGPGEDGERIARGVFDSIRRVTRRGGGNPTSVTTR